jgi:hypothetical protein
MQGEPRLRTRVAVRAIYGPIAATASETEWEGLMQPTGIASGGATSGAAQLILRLVRVEIAVAIALAGTMALLPAAGAEPTTKAPQSAGASNGGVATTTSSGAVDIGEIITGENTGNSIATGDISGPAELHGGEIGYPTEVVIMLVVEPSIASADGGDDGTANATDDDSQHEGDINEGDVNKDTGTDGEDITIINRNDNRSNAKVVNESRE